MGRWMSPDPYMGSYDPSNPQSMNRYSYVLNDPLLYVDPDGTSMIQCGQNSWCVTPDPGPPGPDPCDGYTCSGYPGPDGGPGIPYIGGSGSGGAGATNKPTTNSTCQATLLNMVNSQLGTNFNSSNVAGSYTNGTAYNIIIQSNQLTAAQFNSIQQGRYTTSGWQYLTGVGLAGHIADETNLGFAQSAFQSSNIGGNYSVSFAFHDDHGYANNPIGALIHFFTDVLGHNSRKPC